MDFINNSILLAGVEIGTHYYWEIAGLIGVFRNRLLLPIIKPFDSLVLRNNLNNLNDKWLNK
jgi:hypothetical protein